MKQIDKIKEYIRHMSGGMKKGILFGITGLVIFSVIAAALLNKKSDDPYVTLFWGLNTQEASEVMIHLQETGVDYQYQPDGQIKVAAEVADKTRATLAVAGYPKNGFAYDTYLNNSNMMSTESDKKSLSVWQMQDRLAAIIRCIDGVKDAVVQIAPGENQKYVLDNSGLTVPTASVMVTMKDGTSPTEDQVLGIQRLVAKSVADMSMGDVAVIDGNGVDVSAKRNDADTLASDAKTEFEEDIQNRVESNILNLLDPVYGRNNVRVSVRCTANMQKVISEENKYTAPNVPENAGYIISQTLGSDNQNGAGTGGVPGADTNANVPQYNTLAGNAQNNSSASSDTQFVLDSTKTQSQDESASISDLTVAISINSANLVIDRQELLSLVGNAAGIDPLNQAAKITIVNSEWAKNTLVEDIEEPKPVITPPALTVYLPFIIGGAVALILLFLIIFLLLRRRRKKKERELEALMQAGIQEDEEGAVLAPKVKVPVMTEEDERDREMKENIRDFAEENPEISAQLLKTWLRGDEEHA